MARGRLVVVVLVVLVLLLVTAYLYGRSACPPPDWWVRLFLRSGRFACAA